MKRFRAKDIHAYKSAKHDAPTREWMLWTEGRVSATISDCVEIIESLRKDYDRYYERVALQKAIEILESYENGEEVDIND